MQSENHAKIKGKGFIFMISSLLFGIPQELFNRKMIGILVGYLWDILEITEYQREEDTDRKEYLLLLYIFIYLILL